MTLQQLDTIPKELVVCFEGVSCPVRPKVEYLGKEAREMPGLARLDGFGQLYTPDLVQIYKVLKDGNNDNYSSLSQSQPPVQTGKTTKEAMVDVLGRFADEVLEKYAIWTELLDWQPQKRDKRYALGVPLLYRNWSLSDDGKIDVANAEKVPVEWMEGSGTVNKEMAKQLSLPENTYVYVDRHRAVNNYDGLNALLWGFGLLVCAGKRRGGPGLCSGWEPRYGYSGGGALLGRRPNAYDSELQTLKEDLGSSKELYTELGIKITSIDERIAAPMKMKPE